MPNTSITPRGPEEVRMPFGQHLEELRGRLIKAILGLCVGVAICFALGDHITRFLTAPYYAEMVTAGYPGDMISTDPVDAFMQYFSIMLIFGLGLSAPFGLYQLWQFVAAGLYPRERKWVVLIAPASFVLFFSGVLFFVKLVLPLTLRFLIGVSDWYPSAPEGLGPTYTTSAPSTMPARIPILHAPPAAPADGMMWVWDVDGSLNMVVGGQVMRFTGTKAGNQHLVRPMYNLKDYLGFVTNMCLAFGAGFQIPIVIVILVLLRIVDAAQLSRGRRMVILALVIAGAVLTPSGDITSQLMLAVPMFVLFEAGLAAARLIERGRPDTE